MGRVSWGVALGVLESNPVALARACVVTFVLAMAVACGPMATTDETTAAVGSTGSDASTGSSSGHLDATHGEATDSGTTAAVSTGLDGSSSTGEVCGAAGEVDDCCCFELDGYVVYVICESTAVCAEVLDVVCDGPTPGQFCPLGGAQINDPTEVDCALEALATSSVGHFNVRESPDGGYMGRDYTIYLTGTQEALMLTKTFVDFAGEYDEAPRLMLEPPEYFVACQQEATAIDRYRCMRHGIAEVVEECLPLPP